MSRRIVYALGVCLAVAFGVLLRLHTRAQADYPGGVHPLDSDSAYHLRRARFAAASFPRTIQLDPLMNFPRGGVAIWPPLYDLALALPARLAHGADAPRGEVERGAAWVPVALAAGAIALAGSLGRRVRGGGSRGAWAGIALALFVAAAPAHVLWTQYAHTDQHVAESLCGLLALVSFLASRGRPVAPGQPLREAAAGLALALAVLTWQGAIYWGAIFALSLLLEGIAGRRSVVGPAARTLGLAAAVSGIATLAFLGWVRPPVTYVSFGLFQPLFLAALAGGTAALSAALRAAKRLASRREVAGATALAAAAAAVTLPFLSQLAAGLVRGVGYVAGATSEVAGSGGYVSYPRDWLKGIYEARPLLADGPGLALRHLSAAFFAAPIAILLWAARARRGVRPGVHAVLAVWGAVTLFLALSQRLNEYYAAPLAGLVLIELARVVCARVRRAAFRVRAAATPRIPGAPPSARRRGLSPLAARGAAAVLAAGLVWPMGAGLRAELSAEYVPGSDLFATLGRMRRELPHAVDAYDPLLLGPPPFPAALANARSVLGPWSLGHFLLYEAELPVVANNFGYGFLDSIRFFLAESEDEALAIARERRARWVVATDLSARLNDYASYLRRPPYLVPGPEGLSPAPAYLRTMQARLYELGGREASFGGVDVPALSRFRLVFRSSSAIQRGGRWVPRWAVWEIVE